MNTNRIIGLLLIAYSVYWGIENVPALIDTYRSTPPTILMILSIAFLFISGIGFLMARTWPVVLYWVSVILFGVLIFVYGAQVEGFNPYTFIIINLAFVIIATSNSRNYI